MPQFFVCGSADALTRTDWKRNYKYVCFGLHHHAVTKVECQVHGVERSVLLI